MIATQRYGKTVAVVAQIASFAGCELLRRGYSINDMVLVNYPDGSHVLECRGHRVVKIWTDGGLIKSTRPSYLPHRPLVLREAIEG